MKFIGIRLRFQTCVSLVALNVCRKTYNSGGQLVDICLIMKQNEWNLLEFVFHVSNMRFIDCFDGLPQNLL